ncbi:MAG: crotonase/enoyl-CoA hydratase family protein [Actinomycetota bacterium]
MADFTQIRYDVSDAVATITLSRPEKMNAFTGVMMRELLEAFNLVDADDAVRAVIVTGDGKAFCAGADLSGGAKTFDDGDWSSPNDDRVRRDGGGQVTLRIFDCKKPVIGAINGAAVGIGATMTLPMDVRLASTAARIGFVFTRRGIVPEACSSWFLPRVVGISRAAEWVYTGRILSAQEALDGGLVRAVHAPDDLLPAARTLAREIADNTSGVSVALSRQMLWRMLGASHPMAAHRADSRGIQLRGRSADAHEGVTSFLEKRAAKFSDSVSSDLPDIFPDWEDQSFS